MALPDDAIHASQPEATGANPVRHQADTGASDTIPGESTSVEKRSEEFHSLYKEIDHTLRQLQDTTVRKREIYRQLQDMLTALEQVRSEALPTAVEAREEAEATVQKEQDAYNELTKEDQV